MALREGAERRRRLRDHGRVPLLRRPRARRGLADPAAHAAARALPAHVGHARADRAASRSTSTRAHRHARPRSCARASARCRSTSSTARRRSTRRVAELVERGQRPIYLVNFTQRAVRRRGAEPDEHGLLPRRRRRRRITRGARRACASTARTARRCSASCATASACTTPGCLPKYRLLVEKLAQKGLLKIICGTDTLGVGVNIPIRTVLFTKLCKFDGEKTAILTVRDFQQISGRAGRKGFDDRGQRRRAGARARDREPAPRSEGRRAIRARSEDRQEEAADKGYVHWDQATFERLVDRAARAARVALPGRRTGCSSTCSSRATAAAARRWRRLMRDSHETPARTSARIGAAPRSQMFKSLVDARHPRASSRRRRTARACVVNADLQEDFSLHHALVALPARHHRAARSRRATTYALDLLTLVESILENPDLILMRQLDKLKTREGRRDEGRGRRVRRAHGGAREARVPEAEPRVHLRHVQRVRREAPVGRPGEHPAEVDRARDVRDVPVVRASTCKEYGLQRGEGVLLRYLSDVYKTLVQTVPDAGQDRRASTRSSPTSAPSSRRSTRASSTSGSGCAPRDAPSWPHQRPRSAPARPTSRETRRSSPCSSATRSSPYCARFRAKTGRGGDSAGAGSFAEDALEAALTPFFAEHGALRTDLPRLALRGTRESSRKTTGCGRPSRSCSIPRRPTTGRSSSISTSNDRGTKRAQCLRSDASRAVGRQWMPAAPMLPRARGVPPRRHRRLRSR